MPWNAIWFVDSYIVTENHYRVTHKDYTGSN